MFLKLCFIFQELHSNYTTECIFHVYDPDGMDRNQIHIEVKVNVYEKDIFDFVEYGVITNHEKQYKLR